MLQSKACKALGTLYSKVGKLQEAVNALQKHFDLLKALYVKFSLVTTAAAQAHDKKSSGGEANDASASIPEAVSIKELDLARVYVGISKGNLQLGKYMIAINFDLASLLEWKLNRTQILADQAS